MLDDDLRLLPGLSGSNGGDSYDRNEWRNGKSSIRDYLDGDEDKNCEAPDPIEGSYKL